MGGPLNDNQIALLFDIGEMDALEDTAATKRDLEFLLAQGFIEPTGTREPDLPQYRLTAKGEGVIEERSGGINEA